ncbi:MAG: GNAT family N-acetyltransferase [Chloroflexi bacterium]|nr:GNAT family N-acetyltransferase [Chloroflexota bacterium]
MIRVRSARAVDLPGVAAVLEDAFSAKLRVMVSPQPEKVRALIEMSYTGPVQRGYDGLLVAERDGRIVGTLLVGPMYYTPQENRAIEHYAVRALGMPRMLRAAFLLWLISHRAEPGEAHVTDVAVARDYQAQGIGQLLMEYAERWARDHDRARLTLWVAESNQRAIHVYEKAGFSVARTRSNLLTRFFFGIRRWHFMEKRLDQS